MKTMTNCERFDVLLDRLLLDKPVALPDRVFYRGHADRCPVCRLQSTVLEGIPELQRSHPALQLGQAGLQRCAAEVIARSQTTAERWILPAPSLRLAGALALASVLLVAGLWLAVARRAVSGTPAGTTGQILPRVSRSSADGRLHGQPALAGMPIGIGDVMETAGDLLALRFDDGTRVWVERDSRLELKNADERRISFFLRRGSAVFSVSHRQPGQEFRVGLAQGHVQVIGTQFRVISRGEVQRVQVAEGVVSFSSPDRPSLRIPAGQVYDVAGGQVQPDAASMELLREGIAQGQPPAPPADPQPAPAPVVGEEEEQAIEVPEAVAPDTTEPAPLERTAPGPARRAPPRTAPRRPEIDKDVRPALAPQAPPLGRVAMPTPGAWSAENEAAIGESMARARKRLRQNDPRGALRAYHTVLERYPTSADAQTCLLQIGKIHLDRLGNASVALGFFEQYLKGNPFGVLAEEAALGKVNALGALKRPGEETRMLEEFLRRYPHSAHAPRAEERLRELTRR